MPLLGSSSGCFLWEIGVKLAGDVALEAAHDFAFGQALFESPFDVATGLGVAGHAGHDDAPEGYVGLPVAAAVQPMPAMGFAAGGGDRRDSAESGEAGSWCSRPGLSPAATSSAEAVSGPTP